MTTQSPSMNPIKSEGLPDLPSNGYCITFHDPRDFCRFASILIGATYLSERDALKRFDDGSLFGERTWGKVTACEAGRASRAAPTVPVDAVVGEPVTDGTLRKKIGDLFKIGMDARSDATIVANVTNALHLVDCLMAMEHHLFTTMVPDEDGEEGDEIEDCWVNSWGSEPAQYVEQVRAAIDRLAASVASRAQTEPEGFMLVPIEPTSEMLDAACEEDVHTCEQGDPYYSDRPMSETDARKVWQAMCAASAPKPPATPGETK